MKYSFDHIKPWSWFLVVANKYEKGDSTILVQYIILFGKKISDNEFKAFLYSNDGWVEQIDTMTRDEWKIFRGGGSVKTMVAKEHHEWNDYAKDAIRTIFEKSTDIIEPKR